jgi:tetratricopeptide (TPR) repeat protein
MDTYYDEGIQQLNNGNYEQAIESFSKALRLSLGDLADVLLQRGLAYASMGDYVRALADMDASLEQDSRRMETYNERGNVLRFLERFREALQDFSTALYMDDGFTEARYNRALCYEELGMFQEAVQDLTQVIAQNPTLAQAYEARGRIYAQLKTYEAAITDLQRYLRMGGGREYDNHSETQAYIITLRLQRVVNGLFRKKDLQ